MGRSEMESFGSRFSKALITCKRNEGKGYTFIIHFVNKKNTFKNNTKNPKNKKRATKLSTSMSLALVNAKGKNITAVIRLGLFRLATLFLHKILII